MAPFDKPNLTPEAEAAVVRFVEFDRKRARVLEHLELQRAVLAHQAFALGVSQSHLSTRAGVNRQVGYRLAHRQLPVDIAAAIAAGQPVDL